MSSGTAGLHLAIRAAGVEAGDEVVTTPFSFVASANCLLYENAKPVFCDIDPRTLNIDPAAAAAAITEPHDGRCCRCTSSATRPTCPRFERLAARARPLDRRGRLRGARRGARATAPASARAATSACSASTRTSRSRRGRAAPWSARTRPPRSASTRERNQGRAPDMGWLDHDRLGFNYRLDDLSCALGIAQLERLDELLAGRAARGGALLGGARRTSRASTLPCPDAGGDRRSLVRLRRAAAPAASTATRPWPRMRERGIDTKPYLPAIHLMSFYRERFGHREGEFPVCEDVARRSLALPFFGDLSDGEVEQVVQALREVVLQPGDNGREALVERRRHPA